MKQLFLSLAFFASFTALKAQLSVGDIAFIGYNTDNPDGFSFITLAPITGNEQFYITDQGIANNAWLSNTECHMSFTTPASGIPCGTIVTIIETSSNNFSISGATGATFTFAFGSSFSLASGDQLIAYESSFVRPSNLNSATFIAAIHGDDGSSCALNQSTKWNTANCVSSTGESAIPTGLVDGVNSVSLFPTGTEKDNAKYTGSLNGSAQTILGLISNQSNWSGDNTTPYAISPSSYNNVNISCALPCAVTSLSVGTQAACSNNTYSKDIIVTYSNAPATGTLNVNGQSFAIGASPQTVTMSNLVADGNPVNVTASFSADAGCTKSETALFTAPPACSSPQACVNPFGVAITPLGVNTNTWGPNVADPYTFYFGLSQWKKLKSTVTGGTGPFTYDWGTIGTGQIKNRGSNPSNKYLFQPTAATKIYLNVTDQATSCVYGDTVDILFNDDYFCGTISTSPLYITYALEICQGGVTKCVSWRTGINALKAGTATLGACVAPPAKRSAESEKAVLKLYPNPASEQLSISCQVDKETKGTFRLMDTKGSILSSESFEIGEGLFVHSINVSQYQSGLYLVQLELDGEVFVERVVIK
jgi:hypothetical protein